MTHDDSDPEASASGATAAAIATEIGMSRDQQAIAAGQAAITSGQGSLSQDACVQGAAQQPDW